MSMSTEPTNTGTPDPGFDDTAVHDLLHQHLGVALLNTTIIPPGADGTWVIHTVPLAYVRHIMAYLAHSGMTNFAISHLGHQATADLATELLGIGKIEMDRTPWNGEGVAIAMQLNGRPPEGKVLNRAEMEEFGYTLRILYRQPSA